MLDSSLNKKIEIWGFEQGCMVYKDKSLGAALRLTPIDVSTFSDEKINDVKSGLKNFLNGLPSGMSIQFMQEVVSGNGERIKAHELTSTDNILPLVRDITAERVEKYNRMDSCGELPKRNLVLFLRKPFITQAKKISQLKGFWKNDNSLTEKNLCHEVSAFEKVIESIALDLKSQGLGTSRLKDEEIFSLAYNQWNPDRPIPAELSSSYDIRDQISMTDCVIGIDHFVLGSLYHKVVSLKLLPEVSFASMSESLSHLPFDSRLYLTVECLDQEKEKSSLQTQRRLAYASSAGKKGASDLDAQAKLQDIEAILAEMIQGTEKVFKFSLQILLRSVSKDDLDSQVSDTLALIRGLSGAEGMVETVAGFDIYSEFAIPHAKVKERTIKINTSVLADFLPVYGNWAGHEIPQILLRSQTGSLVGFDPFSKSIGNFGEIISGGSGAGKSFLANLIISQMLKSNPKVYILDIGASYRRFTESLGGQYIELGKASNLSINPLSLDGIDPTDRESFDEKIKYVVSLVEIMTKDNNSKSLGKLEKSELEKCVQNILSFDHEKRLSDLRDELLKHPEMEIKRLGKILSLWCGDAPYGKFVDRPTTVELTKNIVCFDLKALENYPDLQAVCLFLITDLIWRAVQKDRTSTKLTFFDECWKLLESDEGAQFIGSVFRTFRKYKASPIAISQTMDDFSKSKIASAVMPNSSVKWILRQKGADQKSLRESLQLNDREMQLIANLKSEKGKYSEAFLIAEDKRLVVRIESTPLEYWLSTTDPADISQINKAKAEHPELTDVDILRLLAAGKENLISRGAG
jgi:type IV secretory pathway VirB4 component